MLITEAMMKVEPQNAALPAADAPASLRCLRS